MSGLSGKVAIVTGSCGTGIGCSTALLLGRLGCRVVLNHGTHRTDDATAERGRKIAAAIEALGGKAIVHRADTSRDAEAARLVAVALEAFGALDLLVLNAGGDWDARDLPDVDPERWRRTLAQEIDGVALPLRHALPLLRGRGGRVVILGLSGAARLDDLTDMAVDYCLGRAARAWLSSAMARAELTRGVTLNMVEPGYVHDLPFERAVVRARGEGEPSAELDCHDVAEVIAFLCSDAARYVSGSTIRLPTDILPVDR